MRTSRLLSSMLELAQRAEDLASWRRAALDLLARQVSFDAALFHELSPRAPLERGAMMGIDPRALAAGRGGWDENAVLFGRLRDLALAQGGVATDAEAFGPRGRMRRAWTQRIARPLGVRSVMAAHLVVRRRIVSVILLGRRRGPGFGVEERRAVTAALPALAVGDALCQSLEIGALHGPAATLECVDQRLTPRQRELVVQVALGHTNADIGRALGISEHTVRNILTQARARLGAANRAELVRMAVLR